MTRWAKGESAIDELLAADQLQSVRGAQANGSPLLDRARNAINSAASIGGQDPDSAFTLAYDAARFACTALLAQQGLRPTVKGGHLVVERVVRAQFGDTFRRFRDLRIRRHEIEYPDHPDERVDEREALQAIADAHELIDAASRLFEHVGLF